MMWPFSRPRRKPALASVIEGREVNALFLDEENQTLRLRFSDNSAVIVDLCSREFHTGSAHDHKAWLMLPGWVRVVRVIEDASQIILVVAGAIYTARISFRFSHHRGWRLVFSGGRIPTRRRMLREVYFYSFMAHSLMICLRQPHSS
ncbi:MAG: hypothetical protein JW730_04575 [Anaerolineales bacterium]|nr:hypothetical protein [Anaerolineales bacterium]